MKAKLAKIFALIFFAFFLPFYVTAEFSLRLDASEEEFIAVLGNPKSRETEPHLPNRDWDSVFFHYENLTIRTYRIIGKINTLFVSDFKYSVDIDGVKIRCGESKDDIEEKIGEGTLLDRKSPAPTYYYCLTDFKELEITYTDGIVSNIWYGYADPE